MPPTLEFDTDVKVKREPGHDGTVGAMRIGEVARRTGVAPRLVRYYEQQGLLRAGRAANGYRTYTEDDVDRVSRVASMVRAGIPTRLIKVLLDNADKGRALVKDVAPRLAGRAEICDHGCHRALETALITAPDARDPAMMKKLEAVAGRVLNR